MGGLMARAAVSEPSPETAAQSAGVGPIHYPNIDGLRAMAALAVVLCHTVVVSNLLDTFWGSYIVQLRAGVEVFFVVSGFVLYGPFARAHLNGERGPTLPGYFKRRLFRIFPAYWVVLTVGILWLHVILVNGPANTIANYTLTQSYFPSELTGLGPAWTLVIEVAFYVVLPIYATLLWHLGSRRRALAEFVGVGTLAVAGMGCALWSSFGHPPLFITILPANLAPFAVGMGLAVAHTWAVSQPEAPRWSRWMGARPWAFWIVAGVAWSSIVWAVHYPSALTFAGIPGPTAFEYSMILIVVGFCIVTPMVFGPQNRGHIRRGLQLRPVAYLGAISYAIYLWHVPIIYKLDIIAYRLHLTPLQPRLNFFAITGIVLVLTLVVAVASWHLIEKPTISLSRAGYRSLCVAKLLRRPTLPIAADGEVVISPPDEPDGRKSG